MALNKRTTLELEYLYGGLSLYRAGEVLGPRRIRDYELFFMLESSATYYTNGRRYAATPGALILTRPDFKETFKWSPYPRARLFYLHFNIRSLPADWPDVRRWPVLVCDPPSSVAHLMHSIVRLLSTEVPPPSMPPDQHATRLLEALLGEVLLAPVPEAERQPKIVRPEPVERAIHRMRQVFNQQPPKALTLDELAQVAGVSPQHLSRLFRTHLHMSPIRMLGLMRLQLALALLTHTAMPIGMIAERCGFESPFYFSRRFSAHFKRTPSSVRNARYKGQPAPKMPLPLDVLPRIYW